jgi:hypothetical protein
MALIFGQAKEGAEADCGAMNDGGSVLGCVK